jgi:transposase-like protein
MKTMKYTIKDLRTDFPDDTACLKWLAGYLYPDGIHCIKCDKVTPHHQMKTRRSFSCELCGHHVHPTAGTIFAKSSTPLTLWFEAIYLITATRAGISAKQLERTLGVTYKTAWRMFHQIRKMMADDDDQLTGDVEVDEMYMHPDTTKRSTAKAHRSQIVFGMVERQGKAKVVHVKSSGVRVLLPEIQKSVDAKATIYSDEHGSYRQLSRKGYVHETINHGEQQYVSGRVHTQNVENLWSNTKRGIKGVYRHVDPAYLQAYIDEYAFRYSHRHHYMPMFWALMMKVDKAQA